jgi:transposase
MDKASFHKTDKTRQLIEAAGCELLYLPTYSPDLNPIENYWAITKSRLKSKMFIYKKLSQISTLPLNVM